MKIAHAARWIGRLASVVLALGMSDAVSSQAAPDMPEAACAALSGAVVPASGARVVSATYSAAGGARGKASPAYCKVLAQIAPVDPHGQPITVQLNLPSTWNGKSAQVGGGGLDGFLVTADGPGPGANAQPTPLSIGYATFGSDAGHSVASPFDADGQAKAFMNDEVLANYGGAQLKLIPVGWSEAYYRSVARTMGAAAVDRFMRLYTVPGYGHGVGVFTVDWDSLTALDHWVETGAAPDQPVATDLSVATRGRTRPLCRYPAWPRYDGSGDINAAGRYGCVKP